MNEILVAPISGCCFGIQLSAMRELCKIGYNPDICLAGSGGTVACYAAEAASWKVSGMNRIISKINSDVFIKKRCDILYNVIPSDIVAYFSGCFYESNKNPEEFLSEFFTGKSIQEKEIWVGAINERSGRLALFCNKSYEKSHIQGSHYNINMFNSEPLRYFNGDIVSISRSMLASCSIPIMLNSTKLGKNSYIDCGTKFASPLTAMQEEIRKISIQEKGIHIVYVSGYNVEKSLGVSKDADKSMSGLFETIPNHIVRGMVIADRSVAYRIVSDQSDNSLMYAIGHIQSLKAIMKNRKKCRSTLIEIYPVKAVEVNIFDFDSKHIISAVNEVSENLGIRLWWDGPDNAFDDIPNIITSARNI